MPARLPALPQVPHCRAQLMVQPRELRGRCRSCCRPLAPLLPIYTAPWMLPLEKRCLFFLLPTW